MGVKSSKYGALKIVLNQSIYTPGEAIQGTIHVALNEKMPPSSLFLHFKGVEEVSWSEKRGKHTYYLHNKILISKSKYNIMAWDSPLNPGSFAVPFVFILPLDLPCSFLFTEFSTTLCLVYKIYARLKPFDEKIKDKVKDKLVIGISSMTQMIKPIDELKNVKLVAWCCKKKGEIKLNVRWINDRFSHGNPIQCVLDIDNSESKVVVKGIVVTAYCVILATASATYKRDFRNYLFRSTYFTEISPGSKRTEEKGQMFSFDLNDSINKIDIANIHTMKENIIECTFYLDFELDLNTFCLCCGDKPIISSIFFVAPQLKLQAPQIASPENWNPEVLNQVSLSYDPNFESNEKGESQFFQKYKSGNSNL